MKQKLIPTKLKQFYDNSSFNLYYQKTINDELKNFKDKELKSEDLEEIIKNNIFPSFCASVMFQGFVLTPAYLGIRNAFERDFKEALGYSLVYISSRLIIKKLKK